MIVLYKTADNTVVSAFANNIFARTSGTVFIQLTDPSGKNIHLHVKTDSADDAQALVRTAFLTGRLDISNLVYEMIV